MTDMFDLKPHKQRECLQRIADYLADQAAAGDEEDVEELLLSLQLGVMEAEGMEDFFGTEGWRSRFMEEQ